MNYSEVKELLNAGSTAEEIRSMMPAETVNPQNSQDNPQEKVPEAQNNDDCAQNPGVIAAPKAQENDEKFNQLNATMEKLIRTIQSSNLNNNSFDKTNEADIDSQVDAIMAGIIRPERKKEV